jgi:hypothetical protein
MSLDLMGAPSQTSTIERGLDAVSFGPEHISAYALTLEPGTPFATAAGAGRLLVPDDDAVAELLERTDARLEAAGLRRYEVSSWARPGRESQHNQRYWRRAAVLGLGVGAHSSEPASEAAPFGSRSANERSRRWLARSRRGAAPPERERLARRPRGRPPSWRATQRRFAAAQFAASSNGPAHFGAPSTFTSRPAPRARTGTGADRACWLLADTVATHFVAAPVDAAERA